jgi:hypothetical protein
VAADAHQEVVGLDVAVDEVLVVDVLDPADHLQSDQGDQRSFSAAPCAFPPPWPAIFSNYSFLVHYPVTLDEQHLLSHAMCKTGTGRPADQIFGGLLYFLKYPWTCHPDRPPS